MQVLLRGEALQVVGFYCCLPGATDAAGDFEAERSGATSSAASMAAAQERVQLRPFQRDLDAPELEGRESVDADALKVADIWSLGMLLLFLLSGGLDPSTCGLLSPCVARPHPLRSLAP